METSEKKLKQMVDVSQCVLKGQGASELSGLIRNVKEAFYKGLLYMHYNCKIVPLPLPPPIDLQKT